MKPRSRTLKRDTPDMKELHDRLGGMIDQIGHPDGGQYAKDEASVLLQGETK